jgi:hypothetical protein
MLVPRTMARWGSRSLLAAASLLLAATPALNYGGALPAEAANPSATLDQCANGPLSSPSNCSPDAWVNGNLGSSKAHYLEGDSIPYRLVFGSLSFGPNSTPHTVTIEWDTTKSGKHAIDYLTTFDRTVAGANPCAGVSGCGAPTPFAIPADPQVAGAGVTPVGGNFTMYGGTITQVSGYSYANGSGFAGDKSARITVTFTANQTNPVLAWGGHISTRLDWGNENSAVNIPGSPYHTRLVDLDGSGGNQDRSLSSDAVIFPGTITVIKDAVPNNAQDFSFSGTQGLGTFSLDDDSDNTLSNTKVFSLTTFTSYDITETPANGWTLSLATTPCTVTSSNGGGASAITNGVRINLKEGENYSCTFTNTRIEFSPTISTQVKNNAGGSNIANGAAVALGTVAYDTASLASASANAGGTVNYYVELGDNACTTAGATSLGSKAVTNGSVPQSDTFTFNTVGTYYFWAEYSGDMATGGVNNAAKSGCDTELVIVQPNSSGISTAQKLLPNDSATLTGVTANAGGTINFKLFAPNDATCSGTPAYQKIVNVSGASTYITDNSTVYAETVGTWRWLVVYSGDTNNTGSTSACGVENFVITNG